VEQQLFMGVITRSVTKYYKVDYTKWEHITVNDDELVKDMCIDDATLLEKKWFRLVTKSSSTYKCHSKINPEIYTMYIVI
jgi:hypothetical protein